MHKQGCTHEFRFCTMVHPRECDIFPDGGMWLCCGSRSRDGKEGLCAPEAADTLAAREFADDVRLYRNPYDNFICRCRITDTPCTASGQVIPTRSYTASGQVAGGAASPAVTIPFPLPRV